MIKYIRVLNPPWITLYYIILNKISNLTYIADVEKYELKDNTQKKTVSNRFFHSDINKLSDFNKARKEISRNGHIEIKKINLLNPEFVDESVYLKDLLYYDMILVKEKF
jgi:hypothetical protein